MCSAWGLSSSARSEDFGVCYLSGWVCGWLPGLERLKGGVDVVFVVLTCCIVRFMPGEAFAVGGCLLGLLSGCGGFGGPLDCLGVF